VPSTLGALACAAKASPTLHSRADARTDRYRSHSVSSLPKRNPGLACSTARPDTPGFFVMIAQHPNSHLFPVLCARANPSVRHVSSLYVFSAHLLLRCLSCLQSVVSSNTAWSSHHHQRCYVCSGQCPRYNPHRQSLLLHPTL
jgi:hypothetical protein